MASAVALVSGVDVTSEVDDVSVVEDVEAVIVDVSVEADVDAESAAAVGSVVAVVETVSVAEAVSVVEAASVPELVVVGSVVATSVVAVGSVVVGSVAAVVAVEVVPKVPVLSLTLSSWKASSSTARFPQPGRHGTRETAWFVWIDFLRERSRWRASRLRQGDLRGVGGGRPILIVDADARARAELAHLLEDEGYDVMQAGSGEAGLKLARENPPALAVLEVPLGDRSGYEVCRVLREELGEELPVLFLSGARTESYDRVAGLLVGADDYVVKPYAVDELLARVRRLVRHTAPPTESSMSLLTPREREVLRLLAEGLTADEIAKTLFISKKTVGTHLEHIFTKLGVRSRAQAIAVAYRDEFVARR